MRVLYGFLTLAVISLLSWTLVAQDDADKADVKLAPPPKLETVEQKVGYSIGRNIGGSLKQQGMDVDVEALARGIADVLEGRESVLSEKERDDAFAAMEQRAALRRKEAMRANLEAGKKFLVENGKKKGITTTESGLQYEVLKAGTGAVPTRTDTVTTHYKGRLLDGTVFDGSYEDDAPTAADEPISFRVTGVIKGWTEALQLMKVGAHYRLYIPSELAYGERGAGRQIGPNSVLIFDIHLVGIK